MVKSRLKKYVKNQKKEQIFVSFIDGIFPLKDFWKIKMPPFVSLQRFFLVEKTYFTA